MIPPVRAPFVIRPARPADRPPLLELWERSVRATHDFLTEQDIVSLRPRVAEVLASDALEWWVLADEADRPAGFMGYHDDTVDALFIDPDHRGRGGGGELIAHAAGRATGPLSVEVNEQNPAACGFYESQGFEVIGRSPTDSEGRPFPLLRMRRPR